MKWIKNEIDELTTSFINIKKINLKDMLATNVKILIINEDSNKYIIAEKGKFEKMNVLNNVKYYNFKNEDYKSLENSTYLLILIKIIY